MEYDKPQYWYSVIQWNWNAVKYHLEVNDINEGLHRGRTNCPSQISFNEVPQRRIHIRLLSHLITCVMYWWWHVIDLIY